MALVQGKMIRYVHIPDEVDAMLNLQKHVSFFCPPSILHSAQNDMVGVYIGYIYLFACNGTLWPERLATALPNPPTPCAEEQGCAWAQHMRGCSLFTKMVLVLLADQTLFCCSCKYSANHIGRATQFVLVFHLQVLLYVWYLDALGVLGGEKRKTVGAT